MIDGYRTVYDIGLAVSPVSQLDAAQARRNSMEQAVSGLAGPEKSVVTQSARVDTDRAVLGKPSAARVDLSRDHASSDTGAAESSEAPEQSNSAAEQTLPQLSARALATALMNAEPDKALVPRVLPVAEAYQTLSTETSNE